MIGNYKEIQYRLLFTLLLGLALVLGLLPTPNRSLWVNRNLEKWFLKNGILSQSVLWENRIFLNGDCIFELNRKYRIKDFDFIKSGSSLILGVIASNSKTDVLSILNLTEKDTLVSKNVTMYQPWKIRFADVDLDGIPEIGMGVYKKSPLHQVLAKRLFIFNFQQGLQPKWLGSRLSRPFIDFDFLSQNGQTTLYAIEISRNQQFRINTYAWDSFGFTGIKEIGNAYPQAVILHSGYLKTTRGYQNVLFVLQGSKVVRILD